MDFNVLHVRAGSKDGGRATFEELVQDLVSLNHPEVSTIEANPGDWGIDAYVGSLLEGEVSVWQSKFFIDGFSKSQQAQVREAYNSARDSATANGYKLTSWTLCMPCNFDGPNQQWWDRWKKRQFKTDSIEITLWNKIELRKLLLSEDARQVREYYFNPFGGQVGPRSRPTLRLEDLSLYDGALFVKQMNEANLIESDEAKEEFFNAEILVREVTDKAIADEIEALEDSRAVLASLWSQRFNTAVQTGEGRMLPGLYEKVMDAVRDHHPQMPDNLKCGLIHAFGMIHQRVNMGRAGWVRDYKDVAKRYFDEQTNPQSVIADTTLAAIGPDIERARLATETE
ncbi:hypothetical protein [Actinomadura welshii]|uniref:hypothetical protein n=1 Tax=Actinomadura welshii TaxID=3103817 RepID=UPI001268B7BB|nr:hypothetical protein [Actinomadura madurae]